MNHQNLEIEIKNLRLRTIIGFNDWEREKPQDVVISVAFTYDASRAIADDHVEHAVNYRTMTKQIIDEVEKSSFNMVEALADRIYHLVHSFEGVKKVRLTLEKPHSLRFCDNLIVRISDYD